MCCCKLKFCKKLLYNSNDQKLENFYNFNLGLIQDELTLPNYLNHITQIDKNSKKIGKNMHKIQSNFDMIQKNRNHIILDDLLDLQGHDDSFKENIKNKIKHSLKYKRPKQHGSADILKEMAFNRIHSEFTSSNDLGDQI